MKWIFYSLLVANLVYLALNAAGTGATAPGHESGEAQDGARILFLREAGRQSQKVKPAAIEQPTVVVADDISACRGLGPFENIIAAQEVVERLTAIGYVVEMTAIDTPTGASDFRVVLPPLPSIQEAFRRLREFKSRNIDSYVITKGEDAQGISLGVFSTNSAAREYQGELLKLGYEVGIKVIPRINRGYWVQVGEEQFPEFLLEEITSEYLDVGVTETACVNE